ISIGIRTYLQLAPKTLLIKRHGLPAIAIEAEISSNGVHAFSSPFGNASLFLFGGRLVPPLRARLQLSVGRVHGRPEIPVPDDSLQQAGQCFTLRVAQRPTEIVLKFTC